MFTDPISLTIATVGKSLKAVSRADHSSSYREVTGEYEMVISHQETSKRNRRVVRLNRSLYSPDPFVPAQNLLSKYSVYLVVDHPISGFTAQMLQDDWSGFRDTFLTTANYARVVGGES